MDCLYFLAQQLGNARWELAGIWKLAPGGSCASEPQKLALHLAKWLSQWGCSTQFQKRRGCVTSRIRCVCRLLPVNET